MSYVMLIGTGGTIASRMAGPDAGLAATDSVADLVSTLGSETEVRTRDLFRILSSSLTFADVRAIHEAVREAISDDDCLGVVVTHGTDTMEETAFLLDVLHDAVAPVIVTGAQRSADAPDPDGPRNLSDAIHAAAHPGLRGCGVLICFAGTLRTARGARKAQTWKLDAFDGGLEVARAVDGGVQVLARPERPAALGRLPERFDEVRVEVIPCFLGGTPELLDHVIAQRVDGIVLAGMGIGNTADGFVDSVARATAAGIPVVLSTRVSWGPTKALYGEGGGVDLVRAGAILSGDLNPWQSRMLLAALVANGAGPEEIALRFAD